MEKENLRKFNEDVERACEVMRAGGVILYPTDTIWGIGCDACCREAVRRVFAVKGRSESKSLITLVDSVEMLEHHVSSLSDSVRAMLAEPGDRPLTMVLDGARGMAPEVIAADGSAGFRLTREAYSAALCRCLGRPVVSTSANISGHPSAPFFAGIDPTIVEAVDYAASYRRDDTTPSLPSRIVKIGADGTITVIRP